MSNTFVVSDTHFGHAGVCRFLDDSGNKIRPWTDPDEMDADMIEAWNSVVRPKDKVYHLGDVVINRKALPTLHKLHGDKVLIKGNHDIFRLEEYSRYFRDIRAYHVMNNILFSHIPVHPESQGRFVANVHGHLHQRRVMRKSKWLGKDEIDPFYFNASVECIDFRPIALEELYIRLAAQQDKNY